MADESRTEGVPSLTARQHWGKYAAGMAQETLFILALTGVSLLLALLGEAIWR